MPSLLIPVTSSAQDARVGGQAATGGGYPPAQSFTGTTGAEEGPRNSVESGNYRVEKTLLYFDTSSIPDAATIAAAYLVVRVTGIGLVDSRNLTIDYYNWGGTPDATDYTTSAPSDAHGPTALSTLTNAQINYLALSSPDANISKTGNTYLRLHIDGTTPTGTNHLWFSAYDHTTLPEPQLSITYTISGSADQALPPTAYAV